MKKYTFILFAIAASMLASCFGKEEVVEPVAVIPVAKNTPEKKGKHIAGFDFSEYKNDITDKIDIWLVDRKEEGDALEIHYRLDFSKKGKIVKSFPVTLNYDDNGEWSAYGNAIADQKNDKRDPRFIAASYGYPACGYAQTEFIFFAADGTISLFDRSVSMGDGVYSSGTEFFGEFSGNEANTIRARYKVAGAAENSVDTLEMMDITFEDSAVYDYHGKTWHRKALTKKGEVYRTINISEDAYYKSIEQ